MSPVELLIAGTTVAVGACLQGAVGFGLGLLAVPILVLVDPALVPVPLIVASLALNLGASYRNRGGIDAGAARQRAGHGTGRLRDRDPATAATGDHLRRAGVGRGRGERFGPPGRADHRRPAGRGCTREAVLLVSTVSAVALIANELLR